MADRIAIRAARTSLLTGQSVKEVSRDGRRLVFNVPTYENLTAAIADIDAQIEAIDVASKAAAPRYRALSVRFR